MVGTVRCRPAKIGSSWCVVATSTNVMRKSSRTPDQVVSNLLELYDSSFPNYVLFLQNQRDSFHIRNHYHPWEERFRELYGELWCTLQGDWGEGHAAPPAYLQELVLKFALSFSGQWQDLMKEDDFKDDMEFLE